ncbi:MULTISPECIES: LysR family transcriptional regulator [Rhizobium]|jgi:DNA-binding transcriptional LysR family regulator|uniref:HTH-type transcriptional regulator TtuA n=1 Tax=Rhizobium leguminosarum TaxID=384 RepID=A0AAJ1AHV0_RHILE|nr:MULTISPECIES: LysR family transcriptional regulator [Rhizobium]MBY3085999.1 LysR family transcriptional regulator [Rhizobium laguerreae]MBY3136672.1 LysR family transcriptional regulator [Rhizobium laguerreae]MBY3142969.1 LysR family transcriptional regulator [Rhizobium laguerreae]MBY3149958.1 LysR family transcriptional regulator [Rhizobium laguerreae]MBY3158001.1 LysR family transcriptional regulator [Rhizobium laguerreae]
MNYRPTLADLRALSAIVTHRSFRKAADELALSPSTLSHMMRSLEENMGVRLLNRTTRSVAATEAGERLVARLTPLFRDFDLALEEVNEFRGHPSGTLRLNTSEIAARVLLDAAVPTFLTRYPDMSLDLVTDNRLVDVVADGFDAGIRLREAVPLDMIAVEFGGDTRFVAVASPAYLAAHPAPQTPDELRTHACIRFRLPSGKLFRWEFEKYGHELAVDVPGALTLDHVELMAQAAAKGLGIAYVSDRTARPFLESGALVTVLDDWCPAIPGLCLYYPGHRHVPQGLRAFITVLTEVERHGR